MTKNEIKQYAGSFGKIAFNGNHYPGSSHGNIAEIRGATIIFRRLEGHPLTIKIEAIQKFTVKTDPKINEV